MLKMIGRVLVGIMSISLIAKEYTIPVRTVRALDNAYQAYVQLDKTTCYRHEPVRIYCYFTAPADRVGNVQLSQYDSQDACFVYGYPQVQDDTSNGVRTWCWMGVWYPQQTGAVSVPAFMVEYEHTRRRKGRSGMLGSLWGGLLTEHKQVQCTPLTSTISVSPIPPRDDNKAVDLVGEFDTYRLINVPHAISVGTTYEIQLTIEGNGNVPTVAAPQVSGEDHMHIFNTDDTMEHPVYAFKRTFTYTIYVTRPGTYSLTPQRLYAFDPVREYHYTIHAESSTLQAHGSSLASRVAEETPLPDTPDVSGDAEEHDDDVSTFRQAWIPARYFVTMIGLCGGYGLGRFGYQIVCLFAQRYHHSRVVRRAFRKARRSIKQAADKHRGGAVYTAFISVFQALVRDEGVSSSEIYTCITTLIPEYENEWTVFWDSVLTYAFAMNVEAPQREFFVEAHDWLRMLEQRWKQYRKQHGATIV